MTESQDDKDSIDLSPDKFERGKFTFFNEPIDYKSLDFSWSNTLAIPQETAVDDLNLFSNYDEDKVKSQLQKIKDSLELSEQLECDSMIDEKSKKEYLIGVSLEQQIEKTNELKSLSDTYETRFEQLESKLNDKEEINKTLERQNKLLKQEIKELRKTYQPILNILKDKLEAKDKQDESTQESNYEDKEYGIYG